MRHVEKWQPTKYVRMNGILKASSDTQKVGIGSRFMVDLQASVYASLITEHARGRLLDLGCGKVPLFDLYRNLVTDVVCIDWPFSFHGALHLDFSADLNRSLPIADRTFDTLLLTDVFEHICQPDMLWDEVARILRPGGKAIVGVPFMYGIHEQPYDFHRYTEYKLRSFCKERDLEVLYLAPYGGTPEVILDIIAKHAAISGVVSAVHYRLSALLLRINLIRRFSAYTAAKYPLGYGLVAKK